MRFIIYDVKELSMLKLRIDVKFKPLRDLTI